MWIKSLVVCIIFTIQLIFSFEYIWDIIRILISPLTENMINIVHIFIQFDENDPNAKSIEMNLIFIIYCFYIQHSNYHSKLYKNYEDERISLTKYLEQLFKNLPRLKSMVNLIIYINQEIWIWMILVLLFLCITSFNYYILFIVKLVLFFVIMYKFLNLSSSKDHTIFKYIWILIIYSCLNTVLIYLYQFTELNIIREWYIENIFDKLPQAIALNLNSFGLEIYSSEVALKFLPHYGSNLLSVMLLWEVNRIIILLENTEHDEAKNEKKRIEFPERVKLEVSMIKYYLFHFLVLVCKTYWLFIFLSVCAIILSYQLSLAMIIYIFIFCLSFILMFRKYVENINKFNKKQTNFYISRVIRYSLIEKDNHMKIQKVYRNETFKYLEITGMFYIFLIYLYSLFDNIQNYYGKYPIVSEATEGYIKCIFYMIGIYNKVVQDSMFVSSIWGHMLLIIFISFDIYVQKILSILLEKIEIMKKLLKMKERVKKKAAEYAIPARVKSEIQTPKFLTQMRFRREGSQEGEEIISERYSVANEKLPTEKISNLIHPRTFSKLSSDSMMTIRTGDIRLSFEHSDPLLFKFLKIFKKVEMQGYRQSTQSSLQSHNLKLSLLIAIKKILEEVIVFIILMAAIVKLNIISLIYMVYVLIIQIKGKNINRIYNTTIFLCVMVLLQALVFLSNINNDTDPYKDLEILALIKYNLKLPWYEYVLNDGWAFYCSLGINRYQIGTLWAEFIVIIICFIYLDNFCYSLYDDNKSTIGYYNIGTYMSVRSALENISEAEYNKIRQNLWASFKIELVDFDTILYKMNLKKNYHGRMERLRSRLFQDNIQTGPKRTKFFMFLYYLKKVVYLTFHNYILILTLILSMMNSGLISTVYIVFSLVYLYKSKNIVLGIRFELLNASSIFFRIFLIIDLLLQLLYQLPLNSYIDDKSLANDILSSIGINKIHDFIDPNDKSTFYIENSYITLDSLKVVTYSLVSLMVIMYTSNNFKEFYIKYILVQKTKTAKNSAMNTFLFNNKRIELMKKIVNYRTEIKSALSDLEKQLENWDQKLSNQQVSTPRETEKQRPSESAEIVTDEELKEKIREKIKSGYLIRLSIFLNRITSTYSLLDKSDREEYENAIIRGEINIKSKIEKKIDEFVENIELKDIKVHQIDAIFDEKTISEVNKTKKDDEIYYNENELNSEKDSNSDIVLVEGGEGDIKEERKEQEIIKEEVKESTDDIVYKTRGDNTEIVKKNTNIFEEAEAEKPQDEPRTLQKIDPTRYKDIVSNKLFKKYLSTGYIMYSIFFSCFKYVYNNFELLVYLFMVVNNMVNGSLISLVYSILVFCLGIVSYPRNRKNFWRFVLIYSSAVIVFKFIIQLRLIKMTGLDPKDYKKDHFRIGFKIFDTPYSSEFLNYIVWDCMVLLFTMTQIYLLILKGIWEKIEPELETVDMAYDRIFKARALEEYELKDYKEIIVINVANTLVQWDKLDFKSQLKLYYGEVFPNIRVSVVS
jgi:hypothetical protein